MDGGILARLPVRMTVPVAPPKFSDTVNVMKGDKKRDTYNGSETIVSRSSRVNTFTKGQAVGV